MRCRSDAVHGSKCVLGFTYKQSPHPVTERAHGSKLAIRRVIVKSFATTKKAPETPLEFYRIGKMLGRGAFGKVNLAMHKLVRKLVAIKCLNKECLTDEA